MGEYSVSCGFSSLDIREGDQVVLYLLTPEELSPYSDFSKPFELKRRTHLLETDAVYKPTFLPIEGIYNGFASLHSIKRDDNVKAMETFFNLSIEEILETRSIHFIESALYKDDNLFYSKFFRKLLLRNSMPFGLEFFEELGLKYSAEEKGFLFANPLSSMQQFLLRETDEGFELFRKLMHNKKVLASHSFTVKGEKDKEKKIDFLKRVFQLIDVPLGYSQNDIKRMLVLKSISSMFVLKKYFDYATTQFGSLLNHRGQSYKDRHLSDVQAFQEMLPEVIEQERWEVVKEKEILFMTNNLIFNQEKYYNVILGSRNDYASQYVGPDNLLQFPIYLESHLNKELVEEFAKHLLFNRCMSLSNLHYTPTLFGKSTWFNDKDQWNLLVEIERMKIEDMQQELKDEEVE